VAHELAHQWFGDLLTCRDWPHGWLNEGFATYAEVLWRETADGPDAADQQRREDLDAYLAEASGRYARPIVARKFHEPIDLFDRHLYEKGGAVLHELRRRLGDTLFFQVLPAWVKAHRGQSVETHDFARTVEAVTGHNLDRFFDQYVMSPGHPQLKVDVSWMAEEKLLRVAVKQVQPTTGESAFPLFELPLDVEWVAGGKERTERLQVKEAEQAFHLRCEVEPSQVRVDPRREVLGTVEVNKALALWLEELTAAPRARSRTEAALALGKDGGRRSVAALSSALPKERFWATQAAVAKALGMARTPEAKAALLRDGPKLRHPKARRAAAAALGEFRRDEAVGKALTAWLKTGDASAWVEGECARSLGKLRLPGTLPTLVSVLQRHSFQDAVAVGAIDGMAELQDPAAFDRVERLTEWGQPSHRRRAALPALARLAEVAGKKLRAVETLTERLRDGQFRVQMATFGALQELGDRRAVPALESTPFQDGRARRAAKETLRSLRASEPGAKELAALREEVDKLKEEARALKSRVESLSAKRAER
jgi:aminopeptidase N